MKLPEPDVHTVEDLARAWKRSPSYVLACIEYGVEGGRDRLNAVPAELAGQIVPIITAAERRRFEALGRERKGDRLHPSARANLLDLVAALLLVAYGDGDELRQEPEDVASSIGEDLTLAVERGRDLIGRYRLVKRLSQDAAALGIGLPAHAETYANFIREAQAVLRGAGMLKGAADEQEVNDAPAATES